ncbi:hypothetical protein [Inquilinus sp. OTU3971]|uniref:hypothetical protein n=1 Tax=Inquilinus sp. OTU3971 TaxID=3043855 RepID=UPI00313B5FE9
MPRSAEMVFTMFKVFHVTPRRAAVFAALGAALALPLMVSTPAEAWWRGGGWGGGWHGGWHSGVSIGIGLPLYAPPPVYYAPPPPVYYGPPPVYYAPPPRVVYAAPPARAWVPGFWSRGVWIEGHWR